jgi:hypothetical protein
MVKVEKSQSELVALVEDVVFEKATKIGYPDQWHVVLDAKNVEVKGETGKFHTWIGFSPKSNNDAVQEGSVMEQYCTAVEKVVGKKNTVKDVFMAMKGNTYVFKRTVLGQEFNGNAPREIFVPIKKA